MAKLKTVRMRSRYAGPDGVHQPGSIVEFDPKKANALVDGGYAEFVSASGEPVEDLPEDIAAAAKTLAGRHTADKLADLADEYEIEIGAKTTKGDLAVKIVTARKELGEDLLEGPSSSENDDSGDGDGEGDEGGEPEEPRSRDLAPE